jgi:hypothetical protein
MPGYDRDLRYRMANAGSLSLTGTGKHFPGNKTVINNYLINKTTT